MRKTLILGLAAVGASVALPAAAQEKLVVATYGASWGQALKNCVWDPFTKATGVGVTEEPGISTVTRTKLMQQKGNPAIDVAMIDGGISELAMADGTVATLDPKKVANIAGLVDEGVYKRKDGSIYALGMGYYGVGIAYNTKEVKTPPTSWWDLWKKEYEGKITIPSPANAAGIPLFVHLNRLAGGDYTKTDPGVEKLKALKVANYFDSSGAGVSSFQSGEAIIGAHYATSAWGLADQGLPIAWVAPKEGVTSSDIRIHISEGTKRMDAAEKLVNYAVGKDAASCLTEALYIGTPTKGVTPSDKAKARLPWGATGSVKNLVLFNWDEVNANREKLTEVWNKRVVGK